MTWLALVVAGVALFGIGCYYLGESITVRVRRYRVQQDIAAMNRERSGLRR